MANKVDERFNYDFVKTRFLDQVKKENSTTLCTVNSPWSREMIDKIIAAILKGDEAMKQNETVDTFQWKALSKYEVVNASESSLRGKLDDETKVLVLCETNHKKKSTKAVIPSEESFDIISQAHLQTNHGTYQTMLRHLQENYAVKPSNISLVINLCNVCNNNSIDTLNEYEYRKYYTFVIDFSQYPDGQFQYVLVMVVKSNNFVHLRPLVTKENLELAIELLKVFMDFGPPFEMKTNDYSLFVAALDMVYKICPEIKINVETSDAADFAKYEKQVKRGIRDWMVETRSRHWATGCRMVQWEMNNTLIKNVTPYECLFGSTPSDSLATKPVWAVFEPESGNDYQKMIDLFDELYIFDIQDQTASGNTTAGCNRAAKGSNCHVCNYEIRRVTMCHKCDKYMHTICGMRTVVDKNVVTICPKCSLD